jgi:replicative DNA helicase
MDEIRESGDIEQDASVIILLWNCDKEDKTKKGVKFDKNRQGELIKTELVFNGNSMRFTEKGKEFINLPIESEDELPFMSD